eukprot:CAMPEP_0167759396 /NCGR_PEP_ID=MMETSP0110_2-20121227/10998_1 /TAXON_ID=629695 /ORGANISM="Gymnochlora sp., Strain CCMP2014" /LENGTH=367 /DNA_ID=CAMNT_0007645773 /DNA_START=137 /DNA_END=1236 /DNA_ORIENTATION=+
MSNERDRLFERRSKYLGIFSLFLLSLLLRDDLTLLKKEKNISSTVRPKGTLGKNKVLPSRRVSKTHKTHRKPSNKNRTKSLVLNPDYERVEFIEKIYHAGVVAYEKKNFKDAEKHFDKAYSEHAYLLGRNHSRSLSCLHYRAKSKWGLGRLHDALKDLRDCAGIRETTLGVKDEDTIKTELDICLLLREMNQTSSAINRTQELLQRVASIQGEGEGDKEVDVRLLHTRAKVLQMQKRYKQAETLILDLLKVPVKEDDTGKGIDKAYSAKLLHTLGVNYKLQGLLPKAKDCLSEAYNISDKYSAPDDMERYLILGNIAFVTMELGDLNLSEKLFRQTMLSIKERLGSTSAHYHNARGNLGICLLKGEG